MTKASAWRTARRLVRPKVRSGPVNRSMLAASVLGGLAWGIYPENGGELLQAGLSGLFAVGAAATGFKGGKLLLKDYGLRRDLAVSETISADHGSAREATRDERAAAGMDDPTSGKLYGSDMQGNPVWHPKGAPFMVWESPPGWGKSVCGVIPSILHHAQLGHSLVIPDVKCELSVSLAPMLRALGFEVWCINPARLHLNQLGDVELNPHQSLVDSLYGDDVARRDAVKIAADYAALHLPVIKDERNPYFTHGSRRAILLGCLSNAFFDPTHSTPTDVYRLLTDPTAFLQRCVDLQSFETSHANDPVLEVARLEARNMLNRAEKNEENFSSFLEGGTQPLISFNPAGHLGDYGAGAIHNLSAIRERQIIVFIVAPLSHLREFSNYISLLTYNVIAACKAKPNGHPVHIVGEEALQFRFNDLVGDLETMRGLGVTADLYIQSFAGLERHYGKESAAAIESYADVRIYAGLNSYGRAKHVSDMLSEETIRRQDPSYRATAMDELNIASKEMGRRLMTPDEVLSMPKDEAWMFARNMRPIRLKTLSYAEVSPWRDWVDVSPITGTRLHAPARVEINYEKLKGKKP